LCNAAGFIQLAGHFRLMTRARIWRSPLCRFKISTGCLLPFAKQRAFCNQAGDFAWRSFIRSTPSKKRPPTRTFVIKGDYLHTFHYADAVERGGLTMTFNSQHRPLEAYFTALEEAGFLVETLREPSVPEHAIVSGAGRRGQRIPLFLHLRDLRPIRVPYSHCSR
jgi:hypothetical protein